MKPLSPAEMVELGRRLEELEKPRAKGRQKDHGGTAPGKPTNNTPGKLPGVSKGDTRDKVAAALGVSGKAYEKAKAVVEAAGRRPGQVRPGRGKRNTRPATHRAGATFRGRVTTPALAEVYHATPEAAPPAHPAVATGDDRGAGAGHLRPAGEGAAGGGAEEGRRDGGQGANEAQR